MVTEIREDSDKKLRIVFENKKSDTIYSNNDHAYIEKKVKLENKHTKKAVPNKKKENKIIDSKDDTDIWVEIQGPTDRQNRRLRDIAKALKMANQRENHGTDKFLHDVESMVTVFKTELEKMQELFGNILKKLPHVHNVPVTKS